MNSTFYAHNSQDVQMRQPGDLSKAPGYGLKALTDYSLREETSEGKKEAEVTSGPDVAIKPNALNRLQTKDMLASDDPRVRAQAIRNGQLTIADMRKAAGDQEDVRRQLAGRKDLPGHLYWTLSNDNDASVSASVARNQVTPKSVIDNMVQKLEKDAHENVGILFENAHDPSFDARMQIAARANLSSYAAAEMVTDPSPLVRRTLADNRVVPEHVLRRLLHDKNADVCQIAFNTIASKQN